jgi:hypothetical protein
MESCLICHKPGAPTKSKESIAEKDKEEKKGEEKASVPKANPHPPAAAPFKNCLNCHGTGKLKPFPENHASYPVESCAACHK